MQVSDRGQQGKVRCAISPLCSWCLCLARDFLRAELAVTHDHSNTLAALYRRHTRGNAPTQTLKYVPSPSTCDMHMRYAFLNRITSSFSEMHARALRYISYHIMSCMRYVLECISTSRLPAKIPRPGIRVPIFTIIRSGVQT